MLQNQTNPFGSPAALVDKRMGNAYPLIKKVHDSLTDILFVAANLHNLTPKDIELQEDAGKSFLQWRYVGSADWKNLLPLADIPQAEFQVSGDWLQWKYRNEDTWTNLWNVEDFFDQVVVTPTANKIPRAGTDGMLDGDWAGFQAADAMPVRSVQSVLRDQVRLVDFHLSTDAHWSFALRRALDELRKNGGLGGYIQLPKGSYQFGPLDTVIAADEGTAILLGSLDTNIKLVAHDGGTILMPTSNKIEMFAQRGANLGLVGVSVDGRQFGPLQNQLKPAALAMMGGVAGQGNAANCFLRQYDGGGGLSVEDVSVYGMLTGIHYHGNFNDQTQLAGTVRLRNYNIDGCAFGLLIEQPLEYTVTNSSSRNSVNSINAAGSATANDPCHLVYGTNRNGAVPQLVTLADLRGYNDMNSIVQIRKGETVIANGIITNKSGRGAAFVNIDNLTVNGFSSILANVDPTDTQCSGLEITDCSNFQVNGAKTVILGVAAYGIRLRTDTVPAKAKQGRLVDCTVTGDNTSASSPPFYIQGYTDISIENCSFYHLGGVASTKWPFTLTGNVRARLINPQHRLLGGAPADGYMLASVDSTNSYTTVIWNDAGVDVDSTSDTIHWQSKQTTDRDINANHDFRVGYTRSTKLAPGTTSIGGVQIDSSNFGVIASSNGVAFQRQRLGGDGVIARDYNGNTIVSTSTVVGVRLQLSLDGDTGVFDTTGSGSPEGVITGKRGCTYRRRDGADGTPSLYTKTTGTGNTGWTGVTSA